MTLYDFFRRNLQTLQTPKQESNPKQAHPKCKFNCCSSFIEKKLEQLFLLIVHLMFETYMG